MVKWLIYFGIACVVASFLGRSIRALMDGGLPDICDLDSEDDDK